MYMCFRSCVKRRLWSMDSILISPNCIRTWSHNNMISNRLTGPNAKCEQWEEKQDEGVWNGPAGLGSEPGVRLLLCFREWDVRRLRSGTGIGSSSSPAPVQGDGGETGLHLRPEMKDTMTNKCTSNVFNLNTSKCVCVCVCVCVCICCSGRDGTLCVMKIASSLEINAYYTLRGNTYAWTYRTYIWLQKKCCFHPHQQVVLLDTFIIGH